jgi:hypothetical protein
MRDELSIVERDERSRALITDTILRSLRRIVTVNGGAPDRLEEVQTYYAALPPKDVRFFEDKARELSPHLDSTIWHVCNDCQTKFPHPLAFDIEFFRR